VVDDRHRIAGIATVGLPARRGLRSPPWGRERRRADQADARSLHQRDLGDYRRCRAAEYRTRDHCFV